LKKLIPGAYFPPFFASFPHCFRIFSLFSNATKRRKKAAFCEGRVSFGKDWSPSRRKQTANGF